MSVPRDLKYDKDQHLWFEIDGDEAAVGITDYAADQLGEILFVELPDEDDEFDEGDEFSVVESAKTASGLDAPFEFTVIARNDMLEDEPEAINSDAFEHWIVRIKVDDPDSFDVLVDADEYEEFLED